MLVRVEDDISVMVIVRMKVEVVRIEVEVEVPVVAPVVFATTMEDALIVK